MTDLTVSIVNTNNRQYLKGCLSSVLSTAGGLSMEVYVVDNASDDGSAEMVQAEFAEVKLIRNSHRMGFPANHNQVLRRGSGRYFLILNEDTVIASGALEAMVWFMDSRPDVGLAGACILYPDGTWQPCVGRFPTCITEICDHLFLHRLLPWLFPSTHYDGDPGLPLPVDYVIGACMMVRRKTVEMAGLLDEEFFAYMEDVDWCKRIGAAGFKVYYFPEARVTHYDGQSRKNICDRALFERDARRIKRSLLTYSEKHFGRGGVAFKKGLMVLSSALSLGIAIIQKAAGRSEHGGYQLGKVTRAWCNFTIAMRLILAGDKGGS